MRARLVLLGVVIALLAGSARAQTVEQQAEARARFERGMVLMREKSFESACAMFSESLELAADITTAFRLAECYQQIGELGLAWRYYAEVAKAAETAGMEERHEFADLRAGALAERLARLKVNVLPEVIAVNGLTISLDGKKLAPALWNEELRVDEGRHELAATAPGYEPWSAEVMLPSIHDAAVITVILKVKKPESDLWIPPRELGITVTVLGAASLIAGIAVGVSAKMQYDDSLAQCIGDSCPEEALAEQEEAVTRGNIGTVLFGVGAGVLAAGVTMWLVTELLGDDEDSGADVGLSPYGGLLRVRFQ